MKRIIGLAVILLATALLAMGCSSGGEAKDSDTLNKEENSRNDEKFKKADKVANDYFEAIYENNNPKMKETLSPKALEGLENYEKKDTHEFPGRFDKLNGNYEIRRFDNYYDEEKGEIFYKCEIAGNIGTYYYAVLKQNPEGEWKVRDSLLKDRSKIKEDIPDENTGTIIHKISGNEIKNEDENEVDYGFDE